MLCWARLVGTRRNRFLLGLGQFLGRSYCCDSAPLPPGFREEIERLGSSPIRADPRTYGLLLRHCCYCAALEEGKLIHAQIVKNGYDRDTFLCNLLVKMYARCGCLEQAQAVFKSIPHKNAYSWNIMVGAFAKSGNLQQARELFDQMPRKDTVSWTTMITTYAQNGHHREAVRLFKLMDLHGAQPDRVAFISVLNACGDIGEISEAQLLLELAMNEVILDVVLGTSIVRLYGKFRRIQEARAAFESMSEKNVVTWSVMVEANAENGHLGEARKLFDAMPEWSTAPWVIMIGAYARSGELKQAQELFDQMLHRNVAAWHIIMSANAHEGNLDKAAELFQLMDQGGFLPDKLTIVSYLDACAKSAALKQGKLIEAAISGSDFMLDDKIVTNLINLHGKCASAEHARELFESCLLQDSVILWTAMMGALAQNNQGEEAMELLHCLHLYGMRPTRITFTIALFVCSHAGQLSRGWQQFIAMQADHDLTPDCDHYVSMIDLLGRSGQMQQAFELIETMPFVPDDVAWTILLGACKSHGKSSWGARAAKQLITLREEDSAPYVLLASI